MKIVKTFSYKCMQNNPADPENRFCDADNVVAHISFLNINDQGIGNIPCPVCDARMELIVNGSPNRTSKANDEKS